MTPPMYLTLKKGDILRVRELAPCWRSCLVYCETDYDGRGGAIRCRLWLPEEGLDQPYRTGNFRPSELDFVAHLGDWRPL